MWILEILYPSLGIPMRGQPQSGPSIHRFKADEKISHTHPLPQCLSDGGMSQVFRCDLNQHLQEGIPRN